MQIKIISPTEGQTILGDKVTISFITGEFTVGQDGYLNLWLDNPLKDASFASKITSNFDYILSDLPPGPHRITLEAVKPDRQLFHPSVIQSVSFATTLPQTTTSIPSPPAQNIFFFPALINWQIILLFISALVIIIGIFVKVTFGKPKKWEL